MIKKLRFKFILVNMTIVTLMMSLIFSFMYVSTKQNLEDESLQMMKNIASKPISTMLLNKDDLLHLPYFCFRINQSGEVVELLGGYFDLSDPMMIQDILTKSYYSNQNKGVLKEYNLRYLVEKTKTGTILVFADISSELAMLSYLLTLFLLIGSVAFVIFLLISYQLAKWAVKPVEQFLSQQKQFVADASHDLKTPLTVILTDAELLNSQEIDSKEKKQLTDSIIMMAKQMKSLVESLLDLARIDMNSPFKCFEPSDFSMIVDQEAMIFEPLFFEKNLMFQYDLIMDLKVFGDYNQLRQLVQILLDNASKYCTANGQVTLELKKKNNKECQLIVKNTAEQIPSEELKQIFKRFYRLDKARTQTKSYGLGLAIAEGIVENHKGKIHAESMDGMIGFIVDLPLVNDVK